MSLPMPFDASMRRTTVTPNVDQGSASHSQLGSLGLMLVRVALAAETGSGCIFATWLPCPVPLPHQVCSLMASHTRHPLILPLTFEVPEVAAADAYAWTDGRALVATAEQHPGPIALPGGKSLHPSMCATHYIFPGGCSRVCCVLGQAMCTVHTEVGPA
jgi:hypothetical protein